MLLSCLPSTAISDALHSYHIRAMGATIVSSICLYTMSNNLTATVPTGRGKSGNSAFKAVKNVSSSSYEYFKSLIILVAAYFTFCHTHDSLSQT